jgi:hypothetical protein
MDDCISRNPVLNAKYHWQNAHTVSCYPRTEQQHISLSHFEIFNSQTIELQGAHLPFPVGLVSFICNIEQSEFDSK